MKREFSAGGIVFNNQGKVLISQHSTNKHWGFPKGKIDPEEKSDQAALREVREEAGIEAKVLAKVGQEKYFYTLGGEKIFKIVTFFLMEYLSGDIKDHDWEVSEAVWLKPEEALEKLTFKEEKELLKKALEARGK